MSEKPISFNPLDDEDFLPAIIAAGMVLVGALSAIFVLVSGRVLG